MGIYYAENVSFLLDIRIFFVTIWKVLSIADNENTSVTVHKDAEKNSEKVKESDNNMAVK